MQKGFDYMKYELKNGWTTEIDKDVVFKLTNYDATAKCKWTISTSAGVTQTVEPQNGTDEYKVASPIDGTTYTMQVTAWREMPGGNQCSITSDAVSQQCKLAPAAPVVPEPIYQICQQDGTKLWADLVRVSAGNRNTSAEKPAKR